MSLVGKIVDGVVKLADFIINGAPKQDKLEEPIGELEVEKRRRLLEEKRRERNNGQR